VEASTAASDSPTAAVSHTTGVNRDKELTTAKPKEPLPPGRTLQVASEVGPEVEVEAVEGNALVRYTSASASRPDSFRTPGASIPREIRRSFTLLARYYASPSTQASPTPITASLLAFLDNFITNRITPTSFHTVTVQNLSAIEDRLLVDTIRWARSEGITFPTPRPSIHPVHQAQGLSIQPSSGTRTVYTTCSSGTETVNTRTVRTPCSSGTRTVYTTCSSGPKTVNASTIRTTCSSGSGAVHTACQADCAPPPADRVRTPR